MVKRQRGWLLAFGLALVTALAVACAPAADPTATTAAAQPTATTASQQAQPTATRRPQATATTASTGGGGSQTVDPKAKAASQPSVVRNSPDLNPDAQTGGILRIADDAWPADFSGWEAAAGEAEISAPWHDTLMEYNAWEDGKRDELLPNLAYDWWVSNDGETWTFKITEGVKFTDGVDLTCADAQFTVRTIGTGTDASGDELRRSPRGKSISRIDTTECADDYTLVITTNGPMPSLPSTLALGYFQIRPKHVFEGNLFDMLSATGPGAGPFMSSDSDYTVGEKLSYNRNPNYWNQPFPYLDGIEVNAGTRVSSYAALRVGRAERGYTSSGVVIIERENPLLTEFVTSTHGGRKFQVNWTREPWNNPNMARAVQCALDGQKFLTTAYNDVGLFFQGLWPPGSEWGLSPEEVAAVHPCLDPATSMDERREIARGLLDDIGFNADNPARPYIPIWDNCYGDTFAALQEDLNLVNIRPDTTSFESGRAYDIAYSGEFDMIPWCFISPRFDPDGWYYEHYYSTSDRNYGKYTNPEVDALIDLQSVTIDREERVGYINEAERILLEDSAKVILYHYQNRGFHARWLKDFFQVSPSTGSATHRYTRVWIDQADYAASALE